MTATVLYLFADEPTRLLRESWLAQPAAQTPKKTKMTAPVLHLFADEPTRLLHERWLAQPAAQTPKKTK